MKIQRRFTKPGIDPLDEVRWERRESVIREPDGTVVFEMRDIEAPAEWSQVATDILAQKYFRKAGVPQPDGTLGRETSARQVVRRLAGCWTDWGRRYKYFDSDEDAAAFDAELSHMLVHQMAAPNSPQWFNTGLAYAYGITGPSQGHYYVDPDTKELVRAKDSYTHPQPHACLPYDSLVTTPDGPIKIGDIVTRNLVGLQIYDSVGKTRVVAVKHNGVKTVYRVMLANGNSIEATADHLVLSTDKHKGRPTWRAVDALTPGMRLMQRTDTSIEVVGGKMLESEAALAGWLQADGFVGKYEHGTNRSLTVEAMTVNPDERQYVGALVDSVFAGAHVHERSAVSQDPSLQVRRLRLYGENLRPFVERFGLLARRLAMRIPEAVMTGGKNVVAAYLRALFQADGCVRLRTDRRNSSDVVFGTISADLAKDVSKLLFNMGISNRVQLCKDSRADRVDYYHVSIGYKSAKQRFASLIGFVSGDKAAKLEQALSLPGRQVSRLRDEEIVSIDEAGSKDVYDIETASHNFLTNNIVVHNCFIQSVDDDLVNDNGIMDLWVREARLFKYGSGTGTNFSNLRAEGEKLSGGGTSSGLMSFLRVGDRAAGAIKSGGTTRRAAKMVILDVDHPDIEKFINWKVEEEKKVAALIAAGYPSSYEGEAYSTVSGQNSNNSVRIPDKFVDAVRNDGPWDLLWRRDKSVARTVRARDIWDQIGRAAWACADPGIQYDDIINSWHTCPAGGRIRASNPCVTADSLVATADGLHRIDELVDKSAFVLGSDGKPHFVNRIFKTGRKPVYHLRTKAGYELRLTADHKVLTENRGDVAASDLAPGDRVVLRGSGFGSKKIADDLALGIGIAVGDGYLGHATIAGRKRENIALVMDASESPVLERIAEEVNRQKGLLRAVGSVGRGDGVRVTSYSEGTSRLAFSSQPVVDVFKRYAILDKGSARKRFLPAVYDLDKVSVAAVLRGLFTADGTVADYGDKSQYVSLDSTSLELLKQVQLLLLSFGIKAKLYRNRRNGMFESMLPDGKGGSKRHTVQEMHSLRISRSSRVLFEREIGFAEESAKTDVLAGINATVAAYRDVMSDEIDALELTGEEDVYDLTERDTSHFVANGIVVHNCSEYLFLDDTACNLASINLMKFYDAEKNQFDVEAFRHACRIWTIVLEISVLMAQFPSPEIARKSYEYRTLGLGYANLGTLLMVQGIPYDSPRALAIAGALSAILTGESYAASADMAGELGPFPRYKENAEHMLRVMRNHRRAAYNASASEYEDVSVVPMGIDQALCPPYLLSAARECWVNAVELGEKHGYRNAQSTCIAPTGTIGLVMDCDTTGIEPDFALVKFKKLSGGGYFKIINQSLPMTLRNFGYSDDQIEDIVRYAKGSGSLYGAPYINVETLRARGFTSEDIVNIEKALPTVFEIGFAFNQWTLGEPALQRLGIAPEQYGEVDFDLLRHLGFSREEIDAANNYICGTMTIEGAPHLKEEHYAAFDCANKCGKLGKRFIHHMGHVRMMAAAQPFISGAISKTINMPNEATVDEIKEAYMRSWDLGLKSIALYRDGSKLSQPLSNKSSDKDGDADRQLALSEEFAKQLEEARKQRAEELRPDEILAAAQRILANATNTDFKRKVAQALERNRLPAKRRGWTQKAKIAGHTVFLRTGEYADGTLGEIFVDLHKEGASFRSLMNCFAIAVSIGLQYGVPLDEFVDKFVFTRFEPNGFVDHPNIKHCTSVVDYIFRVLGMEYLSRTDFVQIKPEDKDVDDTHHEDKAHAEFEARVSAQQAADEAAAKAQASSAGSPSAARVPKSTASPGATVDPELAAQLNALRSREAQMASLMGDAPLCDVCGSITRRNGACYVCDSCGRSMGCS